MIKQPVVSIVLGSYNRLEFLKFTIQTVREELKDTPHEIIVIDGGSPDGSARWLANQKDIITIVQHNRGVFNGKKIERRSWGYFMNLGFKAAQGKYICMISDDCLVIPAAIKNGISLFEEKLKNQEKIGAIAFYYRNWPDEVKYKVQHVFDKKMYVNHGLYLKSALEEVGYIEEDAYLFYYADADLCLKLDHKGYKCIDSPTSFIEHYKHTEVRKSNKAGTDSDLDGILSRWKGIYHSDNNVADDAQEKDYTDPHDTVKFFRKINSVRLMLIKSALKKSLKKYNAQ